MADLSNASALFDKLVTRAEVVVSNVEILWQTAPPGSDVRQQIGDDELSFLYEMAFLTTFGHWENFVEECLVRMLAGQGCPTYTPPVLLNPPKSNTLAAARLRLLNGQPFMLWHDVTKCITRAQQHVAGSPLEVALDGSQVELKHYAAIRHAIAHRSPQSFANFQAASIALSGVAHASPGLLLRTQDHSDPLNPVRWIRVISTRLRIIAATATA